MARRPGASGEDASKPHVDERAKRSVALVSCAAVLVVLALSFVVWRWAHAKRVDELRNHTAWRQQNAASLLALSAARGLSVDEAARLHRAGDDPAQLRQALVEIHELRLAYASRDLQDAQRRKAELEGAGGYKVYPDGPPETDLVALVNQDEMAATSQIALYAQALNRIRGWKPMSFEEFAAERRGGLPGSGARAPGPVAVAQNKPDPRVPGGTGETDGGVAGRVPLPSAAEIADAAKHPTITVFPDRVELPGLASTAELADQSTREAEMRKTLEQWSHAMVLNDAQAETAAYAPHMDRYFLRTDVDRAFVQADKAAYLRRGNVTASFALQDVRFENETPDSADVRLIKDVTWAQSSAGATHKLIRSELHLVRTDAGWKISGERDFR